MRTKRLPYRPVLLPERSLRSTASAFSSIACLGGERLLAVFSRPHRNHIAQKTPSRSDHRESQSCTQSFAPVVNNIASQQGTSSASRRPPLPARPLISRQRSEERR